MEQKNTTNTPPPDGSQPSEAEKIAKKGISPNVQAALAYVFGLVSGLIVFLFSKDKFAKFHGLQAVFLALGFTVLRLISDFMVIDFSVRSILNLLYLILTIVLIVKAYRGQKYKLPLVGDLADKYSGGSASRS